MRIRLYHNSRCSKSRAALALLRERGVEPEVVEYLKTPPDRDTLRQLATSAGLRPRDLLRAKEPLYRQLRLDRTELSDAEILATIAAHPILLERPIAAAGRRAVIGRPPERVLELV
jgi:arsenate reductase (glutaredoxin)